MEKQGEISIISRKARGGRIDFDARVMSPAKALRLALAKSADKLMGLVVTVTTVEQLSLAHAAVQAEMADDGLLVLLDGANGARGALKFDAQFLAALIEKQTTGTVKPGAAAARPVTRTDAAMVAPLVDAMLRRYDTQLADAGLPTQAAEYRFGDMIEGGRALSLVLGAPDYDLFRLSIDVAEGAKTGVLTLILPVVAPASGGAAGENGQSGDRRGFDGNALEAPVTLDAVLARISLPLKEVCNLAPGAILPVPSDCLKKTQLIATGNHVVSDVYLGQVNGFLAVRFAPVMVEPTARAQSEMPVPGHRPERGETAAVPGNDIWEGHAEEVGDTGADAGTPDAHEAAPPPAPGWEQETALTDPDQLMPGELPVLSEDA